ncbi:hypothetical protein [Amorphus coralli]|uniref:hypothetical protein n=1 Tax=Amorphus coralli TaxID=340680 RepID=UPI000367C95F|nr:hypothetical protein [Amorphus coralli]
MTQEPRTRLRPFEGLVVLATLAAGLAVLFGPALQEGLPRVSGDIFDGRIFIAVLEHWYGVLQGQNPPLSPRYFYPNAFTLSYGDALLAGGLIYSVPRAAGLDPFVSLEVTNAVVCAIGFVATYLVGRRLLGVSVLLALFAALVGLWSNSLSIRLMHAQLVFTAFVPVGLLLVWPHFLKLTRSGGRSPSGGGAIVLSVAVVAFFYLWAMTSFYSLFAFVLLMLVVLVAAILLDRALCDRVWKAIRRPSPALIVLVAGLALAAIAVFWLYSQSGHGGHSVSSMKAGTRLPAELFNVGSSNWVWGGVMDRIMRPLGGNPADPYGLSPVLLVAFLASLIWLLRLFHRRHKAAAGRATEPDVSRATLACALGIGAVVLALFALRFGPMAPFQPVFVGVPGASAIRLPVRFLLFIVPVVALVTAYAFDLFARRGRAASVVVAIVALVILVEQGHSESALRTDRHAEQAFLDSLGKPPAECRSFYVFNPRIGPTDNDAVNRYYAHGVDAMIIGSYLRIPSINGMATFWPENWNVTAPFEPDYLDRVADYAERKGIADGICGLDLTERRWVIGAPQ